MVLSTKATDVGLTIVALVQVFYERQAAGGQYLPVTELKWTPLT
jgi:hypothetical protein